VAQFDEQDRLVQQLGVQFSFNDAGQLRARTDASGTTHYRHDLWGRLLEVTRPDGRRIAYVHDAAGRRVARQVDGQTTHRWVWQDSLRIAAEVDATGNTVARYIHGDRPNVPEAMLKNGKTWRLVSDHLGSVRLVIDATTGQVAQRIDYDEWGQVLSDSNPGFQPFGYAGGLYDLDTGLVRFGVRDYDAATGRWTTKDPIGFEGGDSNLYGYVAGSPVSQIDPKGLKTPSGGWRGQGGQRPIPPMRPDGQAWGAGCGDPTFDRVVPDLFPESCAAHDRCYAQQCGKRRCDEEFCETCTRSGQKCQRCHGSTTAW
jgi:RHS repeat-associated protein